MLPIFGNAHRLFPLAVASSRTIMEAVNRLLFDDNPAAKLAAATW